MDCKLVDLESNVDINDPNKPGEVRVKVRFTILMYAIIKDMYTSVCMYAFI